MGDEGRRKHEEGRRQNDVMNALGQKADIIPMRFIEPGLVNYEDVGTVMVRKETLDKMARSFNGRPIFNETHKETTSRDFSAGRADGVVVGVTFGPPRDLDETKDLPEDGWFWCKAAIWDPETKENCRNGYSLSCAYDVEQWSDAGGIHNNIPYAREVLDGNYTHLAIVPNPRYEGARIIYNSNPNGGNMKIAFWKKEGDKPEVRNASEIDGDKATLTIDGQDVPVGQLVELWNSQQKAKAAAAAVDAIKNAADTDLIEVNGTKVSIGDLKKAALVNAGKNDDDDDDDEKKRKAKEAKEDEERKNAEAKEEERKNAEKEKEEKEKKERENAAAFQRIKERANTRPGEFQPPKVMTPAEREAEGNKRYGSVTK